MNLSETLRERDVELQQLLHQITSLRHKTEHNKELMEEYECQIIDYNRSLDVCCLTGISFKILCFYLANS